MSEEKKSCPVCGKDCARIKISLGPRVIHGLWGCRDRGCGWEEIRPTEMEDEKPNEQRN